MCFRSKAVVRSSDVEWIGCQRIEIQAESVLMATEQI